MSQEGRGIANRNGKIVFVRGAITGEQVKVQCTEVRRHYDTADTIELADDSVGSTLRVNPECSVYEECGGCSLQHLSLEAQQHHKQVNLLQMLQKISSSLILDTPITSRPSGFRHRLRLVVARKADRSYFLGLRQFRSHDAVNVKHCIVANTAVNTLLQKLPEILLAIPDLQGLREIEIDADSDRSTGFVLLLCCTAQRGNCWHELREKQYSCDSVVAIRVRLYVEQKYSAALTTRMISTTGVN